MSRLTAIALVLLSVAGAHAQTKTTEAETRKVLAAIVDLYKAKGVNAASDALNKGEALPQCKGANDLGCTVATLDAIVLVAPRNPAMVGQAFPDLMDIDGKPVTEALLGPMRAGKSSWEARYKFAVGTSKQIVPRVNYCQKFDAKIVVCASHTE